MMHAPVLIMEKAILSRFQMILQLLTFLFRFRLVTKNRYIVEVLNGRIKKTFQYFDKTIQITTIPYMFVDFRIACALLNMTFKPTTTSEMDELITLRMLSFSNKDNALSLLVRENDLNALKSYFRRIEVLKINLFPRLDDSHRHLYACGTYQIKISRNYYADNLNEAGDFECEVSAETIHSDYRKYGIDLDFMNGTIFKALLRSKHSNSVKYFIYVFVDKTVTGINAIIEHTSNCKVG